MRVLFIASYMGVGGAERQLAALAAGLKRAGHEVIVCVFKPGGRFEDLLVSKGIPLRRLNKRGMLDVVSTLARLTAVIDEFRPDVVHGYLGVPNVFAAWAKLRRPSVIAAWGVRGTAWERSSYPWDAKVALWMEDRFARYADVVIANSAAGSEFVKARGFPAAKVTVIPNGIDTERFVRDPAGRARLRAEWGVKDDELLVGVVARLHPMKDHPTFLAAAEELVTKFPRARFALVGEGSPEYQAELERRCTPPVASRTIWAGHRADMTAVYSAVDVVVLSSKFGEGFPNVVGEAMSCQTPCVVTDVGDAARVVGECGTVVAKQSPRELAEALGALASLPAEDFRALGTAARQRIENNFSVASLVARTLDVLQEAKRRRSASGG